MLPQFHIRPVNTPVNTFVEPGNTYDQIKQIAETKLNSWSAYSWKVTDENRLKTISIFENFIEKCKGILHHLGINYRDSTDKKLVKEIFICILLNDSNNSLKAHENSIDLIKNAALNLDPKNEKSSENLDEEIQTIANYMLGENANKDNITIKNTIEKYKNKYSQIFKDKPDIPNITKQIFKINEKSPNPNLEQAKHPQTSENDKDLLSDQEADPQAPFEGGSEEDLQKQKRLIIPQEGSAPQPTTTTVTPNIPIKPQKSLSELMTEIECKEVSDLEVYFQQVDVHSTDEKGNNILHIMFKNFTPLLLDPISKLAKYGVNIFEINADGEIPILIGLSKAKENPFLYEEMLSTIPEYEAQKTYKEQLTEAQINIFRKNANEVLGHHLTGILLEKLGLSDTPVDPSKLQTLDERFRGLKMQVRAITPPYPEKLKIPDIQFSEEEKKNLAAMETSLKDLEDKLSKLYIPDLNDTIWHGQGSFQRIMWHDLHFLEAIQDPLMVKVILHCHKEGTLQKLNNTGGTLASFLLYGMNDNNLSYLTSAAPNWRITPSKGEWGKLTHLKRASMSEKKEDIPFIPGEAYFSTLNKALDTLNGVFKEFNVPFDPVTEKKQAFKDVLPVLPPSALLKVFSLLINNEEKISKLLPGDPESPTYFKNMYLQTLEVMSQFEKLLNEKQDNYAQVLGYALVSHVLDARHLAACLYILNNPTANTPTNSVLSTLIEMFKNNTFPADAQQLLSIRFQQLIAIIIDKCEDYGIPPDKLSELATNTPPQAEAKQPSVTTPTLSPIAKKDVDMEIFKEALQAHTELTSQNKEFVIKRNSKKEPQIYFYFKNIAARDEEMRRECYKKMPFDSKWQLVDEPGQLPMLKLSVMQSSRRLGLSKEAFIQKSPSLYQEIELINRLLGSRPQPTVLGAKERLLSIAPSFLIVPAADGNLQTQFSFSSRQERDYAIEKLRLILPKLGIQNPLADKSQEAEIDGKFLLTLSPQESMALVISTTKTSKEHAQAILHACSGLPQVDKTPLHFSLKTNGEVHNLYASKKSLRNEDLAKNYLTLTNAGGAVNIGAEIAKKDPNAKIGVMIAANSGLPAGALGYNPDEISERHLNLPTQEESVWAAVVLANCGNNREKQLAFYANTIQGQWGLLGLPENTTKTRQGIDFTQSKDTADYNNSYVLSNTEVADVTIENKEGKSIKKLGKNRYKATIVFADSVNANPNQGQATGTMKRTLNPKAAENYNFFCECIRQKLRSALDGMAKEGVTDPIVAKLSCGIYAHPDHKIQINNDFYQILQSILEEPVGPDGEKRGQYFKQVIVPEMSKK